MDTLISLGTLAAWGWSVIALFFLDAGATGMKMPFELTPSRTGSTGQIYLEVAAVVVTCLLAGRYFEARAKRSAGSALRALVELEHLRRLELAAAARGQGAPRPSTPSRSRRSRATGR